MIFFPVARFAVLLAAAVGFGSCYADIYKSVDSEGRVTYSNMSSKGAKRIDVLGDPGNSTRKASAAASPSNFPKVDSNTQKSRDSVRRRILSDELATEEKLLAEAQIAYKNGSPEPSAGETITSPKYLERVSKLRQSVTLHERNIIALKQELAALK